MPIPEQRLLDALEQEKAHYVAWMHAGRPGNQNAVLALNSIIEAVKSEHLLSEMLEVKDG